MDHTRRFMELLGIRDGNMKIIHVAGTNGKGSTCAYMNGILCKMKENVGLFTSPHLEHMTERIRMNGMEISREEFVSIYLEVMKAIETMQAEGLPHPSFFEFLLGMGMKAFQKHQMTYVILETGLGGRLDATNVFTKPAVTVLTSIGIDHQAYLGETIEEIAGEKAGIIKPEVPLIYCGNDENVAKVIEEKVEAFGCKCRKITDSAYEIIEKTEKDIAFSEIGAYDEVVTWKIKNRGSYQVENAMIAISTLRMILPEEKQVIKIWQDALMETVWAGRMEEVSKGIFIDGAHNISAIKAILQDHKQLDVLMFSAVSDKDYKEMIQLLVGEIEAKTYVVTTIEDQRAVQAQELKLLIDEELRIRKKSKPVYVEESIGKAWNRVVSLKSKDGKALCLGSLYLVGMIKEQCGK